MRMNMPVTNTEISLNEDTLIVSKTDLKGQITYINKDFIEISGFSEAELIGQPHNIVRHPDMPVEAYEDLWRCLKAGRPWTGMVKNRCKNGDYYWVQANATPIREGGQIVGYMSVRRKPNRMDVEAADSAYRLFREKRAGSMRIENGGVVKRGLGNFTRWLRDVSIKSKLLVLMLVMAALLGVMGWRGLAEVQHADGEIERLYKTRVVGLATLTSISQLMTENRAEVLFALQHDPASAHAKLHDHALATHLEKIEKNSSEVGRLFKVYEELVTNEDHKALLVAYEQARKRMLDEGQLLAIKAIKDGRYQEANELMLKKANPLFAEANKGLNALLSYQQAHAKQQYEDAEQAAVATRNGMLLTFGVALLIGLSFVVWLIRLIKLPLQEAIDNFQALAQGDYTKKPDIARNDEFGAVLQNIQSMQIRLGFDVAENKRVADENLRIKIGLDNVATNVMIADDAYNIIYMNRSLTTMMSQAESDLRKDLPNFSAATLMGTNIDVFHKNPAHQRGMLDRLTSTHKATIVVGGRTFTLTVTPVINVRGQRLGTAVEWLDRTAEVATENEVSSVVAGAANGDFTTRIKLEGKDGFFLRVAEELNRLLDTAQRGLDDVAHVLSAMADGDLTQSITADYSGTFGQLKDDTNTTVARLQDIIGQIKNATDAINTASKEIASGNQDLSSRTEEQASSLEETASSMEQLTGTVKQNAENALQANTLADSAQHVAEQGGVVVGQVVETMGAIHQSSSKIADIIGVIDGIAFQTNILALNAAVEAARAGEQGRGFAVVATEVRNLAQRSAAAAKEIKGLISDSVDKVQTGSRLVDHAGQTMGEVVASIKKVAHIMADISAASREQSAGIEQVSLAITQMDEVTQQNAALVEEAAAAAESLEEQAHSLAQAVAVFRVDDSGRGAAQPQLRAPQSAAREGQRSARPSGKIGGRKAQPALPASLEDEWSEF